MKLQGLYYPFSRCINLSSLKQLLLVFDSVTFLDPVLDDKWRAELYKNLETQEDIRYRKYRDLYKPLLELKAEGAVEFISPVQLPNLDFTKITASTLSDLMDSNWYSIASDPLKYNMPHQKLGSNGSPSWDIFKPKLPDCLIDIFRNNYNFSNHLIREGGENYNWSFSYQAGSAISTNFHLAAANKLGLSPTTDSIMHHDLLLKKFFRAENNNGHPDEDQQLSTVIGQNVATTLLKKLLDDSELSKTSFDEILEFRQKTKKLREDFLKEINNKISIDLIGASEASIVDINKEIVKKTSQEITDYQNEITSAKSKIWPAFTGSLNKGLATGGLGAVAFSYLGGTEYLLGGSILAASLTFLTSALTVKNEIDKNKIKRTATVNYITSVQKGLK